MSEQDTMKLMAAALKAFAKTQELTMFPPYGSPPRRRRGFLRALRAPALLLAGFVLPPVAITASWMLFPLWFIPLHEATWGPIAYRSAADLCGAIHMFVLILWLVTVVLLTAWSRAKLDRWWWNPPLQDE